MKSQFSFTKAVVAGINATVAMTLFTYMGGMMNIKMDIPAMLGSMFGVSLIMGWIMHFIIGTILSISYGLFFYAIVNINPLWLRETMFWI